MAAAAGALDVHRQDTKRRELGVLSLRRVAHHLVVHNVEFVLAHGLLVLLVLEPTRRQLDPVPPHNVAVHRSAGALLQFQSEV